MNTVEKGDMLEIQVFNIIKELVERNAFFVNGKFSKVFLKKGYPSQETGETIIFDITIETYLPGADHYSSLIVIECKNYGTTIPVRTIQKLSDDLSQVGRDNTKGIIISNSNFQKGTRQIAKKRGIALARISNHTELEWTTYRKEKSFEGNNSEIVDRILEEDSPIKIFFAYFCDRSFENFSDLLIELGAYDVLNYQTSHLKVPYKSDDEIEKILSDWPSTDLFRKGKLDTDLLCQVVSKSCGAAFDFDTLLGSNVNHKLLGKIEFDPLKIWIDRDLKSDKFRWRFTLVHEIGHLVLHYDLLHTGLRNYLDTSNSLSFNEDFGHLVNSRLEIQANRFASFLLLPSNLVLNVVSDYFEENNIYKPCLTLDKQLINMQIVFGLLEKIQNTFEVSKEVAKLRLKKMNILIDKTDKWLPTLLRGKSIQSHLNRY